MTRRSLRSTALLLATVPWAALIVVALLVIAFLMAALLLAGCTVGPDYRRPAVAVPPDFRGGPPGTAESLGDVAWWKIFQDETLQSLIRTALAENYDLRIAAARILEARAQVTIVRSAQFPDVSASASAPYVSLPGDRAPLQSRETFTPLGTFDLVWELDLWGRLRRATEAARAQLLASEDVQRFVVTTLVSDVATAYFQLRELDLELEISRRTLTTRQEAVRLVTLRYQGGVAALIDLRQAEVLLYTAAATIPDVMLERRPDVRQAEDELAAATARIGVAKAEYFPKVSLIGSAGVGGTLITGSWFGPTGLLAIGPQVSVPIFNMGRVGAGVDSAVAQAQAALARYQQTIQQAFRDVSDALVEHRKRREARIEQQALVNSLTDAARLANVRYRGGVTSYLEVLDTERQLFDAELQLAQFERDELLAVVRLYRALGGGWTAS